MGNIQTIKVKEMFKIKKIKPLFTNIVTTAKRYVGDQTESGLVLPGKMDGTMNRYQTVVAAGPMASGLKEGDIVCLNFSRYMRTRHVPGKLEDNVVTDDMSCVYEIPVVEVDGQECLLVSNSDVEYVVEEAEIDDGGLLQ